MILEKQRLLKLAKLARIAIKEEEIQGYLEAINADIAGVDNLETVDTEGLEPLVNAYDIELETHADVVADGNIRDEILANSPKTIYDYFAIPKILEQ